MEHSKNEEVLFAAALALPAAERRTYLHRACTDASTRERLHGLVDAFGDASSFVNERAKFPQDGAEHIGPYRLMQELGEGGCGVAYLAEQTKPVKRHVALKIIKPGMDTRAVIARFGAERQMLALMDHPNVAKVFDAGTTANGRPYFVMELVRGIRVTDYCEQTRSTIPERLSLFIQVCQAIQHAHQKGIIHRDVKPSNVLVTLHDGTPVAKVIDFGIAKAMQSTPTDHTVFTMLGHFVGTPAYVSPEQTELTQRGVDTRSDIYSLGVLLYELLTGCTPFDTTELMQAGLEQMRKRIREEEPPTPSKRLSMLNDGATTQTMGFHRSVAKLARHVHGDLDWIVMRCLEKDRARRYQTISELISDVQHYLTHEPIAARPPSVTYVMRTFAQRHRIAFAVSLVGIVFMVFIVAFAITATLQTQRIAAERERAEQEGQRAEAVSDFMLRIFDASQPQTSLGRVVTAREILDEAGRRIRGDLNQQPEVRARLLEAIGRAYRRLNLSETAVPYFEDALRTRRQLSDPDGTKTASVLIELAISLRTIDNLKGADNALKQALAISREHRSERSTTYAKLMLNLGRVDLLFGNLTEARRSLEESLALSRELLGPTNPEAGSTFMELSSVFMWNDALDDAEQSAREALRIFNATRPPGYPDCALAEARLGQVLLFQNRINEAAPLLEDSLAEQTQLYGAVSLQVADVLDALASIKRAQGLFHEAEAYSRKALKTHEAVMGAEHSVTGYFRTSLAVALVRQGKYQEAEQQIRRALEAFEKTLPPDHQYVAASEHLLGEVLLATNRLRDAEATLIAAMNRWKRTNAPSWRVARSESALGETLYRQGRTDEAEHHLRESYLALATDEKADRDARVKAQERITRFYSDRRQREKLEQLILAAGGNKTDAGNRLPVSSAAR